MAAFIYPSTARVEQIDDFHGTLVADPYRWLEDTDSPETRAWIEAQNELTFGFLKAIPEREAIRQRLTQLWDYAKFHAPVKRGGRYFQLRNTGLQNQDVLFVMDGRDGEARVLLDPNTLSSDGTVALTSWEVSPDGNWLAYATSASGSDWLTWRVREVANGSDLAEVIEWSKFSGATWLKDNSGFYYARYAEPVPGQAYQDTNYDQKLYFHKLKTPQSEDVLVYERPDHKDWGFAAEVTQDGRYLCLHVWQGTQIKNLFFYQDLHTGGEFVELIPEFEAAYQLVGAVGERFYLHTDLEAARGKVIALDLKNPEKSQWQTVIAESQDVLEGMRLIQDQFIGLYLHDAHHEIRRYTRAGEALGEIDLPALGSVIEFSGSQADPEIFFSFSSFVYPATIMHFDVQTGVGGVFQPSAMEFDASPYDTRQVFVTSKDGTRVPLYLVHRRGLQLDGSNPTLLYGYGGFFVSVLPAFSVSRLAWLELGGVLAVANLRGGAEYGEEWHQAGMIHNKQNVFDDFIACAEYLIAEKITSTPKLAIQGRSNGGLLVGACMTQRPDLFGAALPAVGVMDMLRFHKFTIGWGWVSDYGCADDPEQFKTLYAYSPYHNLKPGTQYPATLVSTGDHDDRVVPGHSFKFAAALQAAQAGAAPTLIRIQTKAGHGFGKPTAILIEEETDNWAFLVNVLGIRH